MLGVKLSFMLQLTDLALVVILIPQNKTSEVSNHFIIMLIKNQYLEVVIYHFYLFICFLLYVYLSLSDSPLVSVSHWSLLFSHLLISWPAARFTRLHTHTHMPWGRVSRWPQRPVQGWVWGCYVTTATEARVIQRSTLGPGQRMVKCRRRDCPCKHTTTNTHTQTHTTY